MSLLGGNVLARSLLSLLHLALLVKWQVMETLQDLSPTLWSTCVTPSRKCVCCLFLILPEQRGIMDAVDGGDDMWMSKCSGSLWSVKTEGQTQNCGKTINAYWYPFHVSMNYF